MALSDYRHHLRSTLRRWRPLSIAWVLGVVAACGQIPDGSPTLSSETATQVESYGFSILVDTSLVNSGWGVREFAYSPAETQQFRSVAFPLVYEMFVDRPSFNGQSYQPLNVTTQRVESGRLATRVIVRVLERPPGIPSFEALVDTVRNLNQSVTDISLNGHSGIELSLREGGGDDPGIYQWSHAEDMVPRMIFSKGQFLYFVNTFQNRGGNNSDTSRVASVLETFQILP